MLPDPRSPGLPTVAPLYSRPPFCYRDCLLLVVGFRTDPHALRRFLPEPLAASDDGRMVLITGRLHNDRVGSYGEAILAAPCSLGERTGNYAVACYLDRPSAIVAGREIWGWPKKDAVLSLAESRDRAAASVERNGTEIIRASVERAGPAGAADLAVDPTWFNLKLVPSVTDGAPPDVMQLTETTLANVIVREAEAGPARLGFASTIQDPVAQLLPMREVLGGVVLRMDFDLLDGVVVHDYVGGRAAAPALAGAGGRA